MKVLVVKIALSSLCVACLVSLSGASQVVEPVVEMIGDQCHGLAYFPNAYRIPFDIGAGDYGVILNDDKPEHGVFALVSRPANGADATFWMNGRTETGRCGLLTEPVVE